RDRKREHDAGARIAGSRVTGKHKNARADDSADAERDQMDRPKRLLQVVVDLRFGIFRNAASHKRMPPVAPGLAGILAGTIPGCAAPANRRRPPTSYGVREIPRGVTALCGRRP